LLRRFLVDLHHFFINVSTEEVSPLRRILLRVFDLLKDLTYVAVLTFLDCGDFSHDILKQVLDEHLGVSIAIHSLVNLNPDHLTQLVRYLHLVSLEAVNLVPDSIVDLGDLRPDVDLLLGASHLFLPDPAINAPDLGLEVGVQRLDRLVFPLELVPHI